MEHRAKGILRLSLADFAFREALALTNHLLNSGIDEHSELYTAMCSGIVVSYCRPFMSADGLGRIGREFEDFSGSEYEARFRSIHDIFMRARNMVVAHKDLKEAAIEHSTNKMAFHPGRIELHIKELGMTSKITALTVKREVIEGSIALFEHQRSKATSRIKKARQSIYSETEKEITLSYEFE